MLTTEIKVNRKVIGRIEIQHIEKFEEDLHKYIWKYVDEDGGKKLGSVLHKRSDGAIALLNRAFADLSAVLGLSL